MNLLNIAKPVRGLILSDYIDLGTHNGTRTIAFVLMEDNLETYPKSFYDLVPVSLHQNSEFVRKIETLLGHEIRLTSCLDELLGTKLQVEVVNRVTRHGTRREYVYVRRTGMIPDYFERYDPERFDLNRPRSNKREIDYDIGDFPAFIKEMIRNSQEYKELLRGYEEPSSYTCEVIEITNPNQLFTEEV